MDTFSNDNAFAHANQEDRANSLERATRASHNSLSLPSVLAESKLLPCFVKLCEFWLGFHHSEIADKVAR